MDKRFLAILGVVIAVFIGIFIFSQDSNGSNGSKGQPTNHVQGKNTKNVTLMEYGDYQCPICGIYYQPLKQVQAQFNDEIHFQFRNLPLVGVHPNAFAAARAAEAADLQGKYWEMHDKLYENQPAWSSSTDPVSMFKTYAQQIGLDATKFATDYSSSQVNDRINADLEEFSKTNQPQSTPTFFLNGKVLVNTDLTDPKTGQPDVQKFADVINAEIAKQEKQ